MRTETPAARTSERRLPLPEFALVGIAAVWGLTFVMVQDAVAQIPVMTFLAYRFVPAAAVVAVVFRRRLRELGPRGWRAGAIMGIFLTSGYIFQTLGLQHTTAANAGFITGMFVVLTPIFGALFLRHRAGRAAWGAAFTSAIGLYLLSGAQGGHLLGDALVFGCACSFACHILATDSALKEHHAGALLVVQLALCGLFCLGVAGAMGDLVVPRSAVVWNALLVTSLIASALGFFVQTWAQQHAPPARTAIILASEPAFAGLFAFLLANEVFTGLDWAGAALIFASIVLVEVYT
ncbi:MAG: DMT family transporter, partial [Actinomycetota bacterium]